MDKEVECRLKREAAFQNQRTIQSTINKKKGRIGFYFLADTARKKYHELLYSTIKNKRVLIVGCAEGGVTPILREGAKHVVGIDIADAPIAKLNESIAKQNLQNKAVAKVMNAEALDFPADSFDVICCTGVLHHLDILKSCQSWSGILAKDGIVIMLEPMAYNPFIALFRLVTPNMRTPDEHPLVPSDFKLMKKYFKTVRSEGFVLTSLAALPFGFFPKSSGAAFKARDFFEVIDNAILKIFPPLIHLCWTSLIVLESPKNSAEKQ